MIHPCVNEKVIMRYSEIDDVLRNSSQNMKLLSSFTQLMSFQTSLFCGTQKNNFGRMTVSVTILC